MTTVLGLQWANVEDLPSGPTHEVLLFEQPTLTAIGLVVLGLVAAMVLQRMGKGRVGAALIPVSLLLAVGVVFLARSVETTREMLTNRTEQFVERFVAGDVQGVERMLSERVVLASGGADVGQDRAWLVRVAAGAEQEVLSASFRSRGAILDDDAHGRTRFTVATEHGEFSGEVTSSWEFSWRQFADGWRIVRFECLSIRGQKPSDQWVGWGSRIAR
ncbi:MAG: hypothetical protein AAFX05_03440 [Planctomycetota bacterium]